MRKARFFLALLAYVSVLVACSPAAGQLKVSDVWARPGLAGGNSAVYFVISNETAETDSLLSASSDVASAVEMHMTTMQDGNMQMEQQEQVPVPAGKTEFQPSGLHVMLIDLNQDLKPGDTFRLTLDFAKAGAMPLDVTVSEP